MLINFLTFFHAEYFFFYFNTDFAFEVTTKKKLLTLKTFLKL